MKKLFYSLMIAAAGLFVTRQATAQENIGSVGLELALPVGDFADGANFGIGASAGYELGFTDRLSGLANVGYIYYTTEGDGMTLSHIPLQLGARFYMDEQRYGAYVQAKLGVHLQMMSFDSDLLDDETEAYFSAAPEVGYFLTENLSLGLRYQMVFVPGEEVTIDMGPLGTHTEEVDGTTLGYIGLRAAYNF